MHRRRVSTTHIYAVVLACCAFTSFLICGSPRKNRSDGKPRTRGIPNRYRNRAYISDLDPFGSREDPFFSRTGQGESNDKFLHIDDVKVKAVLKDVWRSDSLPELEQTLLDLVDDKTRISVAKLEIFLCAHDKYTGRVDTYQSSRCLALCEKNESFAKQYANTTCKYFNSRKFWENKFPGKAYVWTADLHSGPFSCDRSVMEEAGAATHAEIQYSKCAYTGVCADRLRVFRNENMTGYSLGDEPEKLRRDFFEAYKHDPEFARVDAFLCTHPTANCELFMPFNKSIIVDAAARIEFGRYDDNIPWRRERMTDRSFEQWRHWVRNLKRIASRPNNVIMANNLYDVAYIEHMTDIKAKYMPAWCGDAGVKYDVPAPHSSILIGPYRLADSIDKLGWEHPVLSGLSRVNTNVLSPFEFHRVTDLYPSYSFRDLASHRAIVFLPYQVSIMSFFEYYRIGVPLFVPSQKLLLRWDEEYDVLSERIYGHVSADDVRADDDVGAGGLEGDKDLETARLPDPNVKANLKYWIHLCDFYVFPHVQYFDSWEDLVDKLRTVDMQSVSKAMLEYSEEQRFEIVEKWKQVVRRIVPTSRRGGTSVVPTDYDGAMQKLYDLHAL